MRASALTHRATPAAHFFFFKLTYVFYPSSISMGTKMRMQSMGMSEARLAVVLHPSPPPVNSEQMWLKISQIGTKALGFMIIAQIIFGLASTFIWGGKQRVACPETGMETRSRWDEYGKPGPLVSSSHPGHICERRPAIVCQLPSKTS